MDNMSKMCNEFVEKCHNMNCENVATAMCERCREGYCSFNCQAMDWRRHKKICKPMPLLVPYESPRSLIERTFSQTIVAASPILGVKTGASENQKELSSNTRKILAALKSDNRQENGEAAPFPVKSSPSIAATQLGPKSDIKVKIERAESVLEEKLPVLPTINGKHEKEKSSSMAAKEFLFPQILSRKKGESAQTPGKALSIKMKEVVTSSKGTSELKAAEPVAASTPILFGKKAVELLEKKLLATEKSPGSLKSINLNRPDEDLTTNKAAPLDVAASSTEEPLTTSEVWQISYESEYLKFIPFRIQHINKNNSKIVWIIEESNLPYLEALTEHMQKYISENLPVREEYIAESMLLIGVNDRKQVYRGIVIQNLVQQKKVLIQAIDYGKKGFIDYSNLYKASAQAVGTKAFAFPVEIQGKTYGLIKPEARIHMRLIGMDGEEGGIGGLIKAKIQYESFEKIMELVSLNDFEIKILKVSDDGQSALVQSPCKLDVITEDLAKAMESSDLKTFTNTEGTLLVAAHTAEGWRRAVIIDSLPGGELYLIYLVDEGCLKITGKLQSLPKKVDHFTACTFAITVKRAKVDLRKYQINDQLAKFEILYDSNKKVVLHRDTCKICQVYLKSYFDDKEFCIKLAIKEIIGNGSHVYITKLINHAQVYINLDDSGKYAALFNVLAPKCTKYIRDRPTVQDIVLVKTNGGDYYRGEIILLSFENEDTYDVLHIDTGNLHKSVHVEEMLNPCSFIRYLPRHLQELNLTMLNTIPAETVPDTSAMLHRLNEYIQEGTLFKVEYSGNSFTEGNLLFLNRKGVDLSMELLALLNRHVKDILPTTDSDVDQISDDTLIDDDDGKPKLIPLERKNFQFDEEVFKSLPPSPPDSPQPEIMESDKENSVKLVTKNNKFERFTLEDVELKKIPSGQNIGIFLLDSSNLHNHGFIRCTYFENRAEIEEFDDNIDKVDKYGKRVHKEIMENYLPGIDEICVGLLKEDGRWYRAQCLSHDGDDMITIMFLDFGTIEKFHKAEIVPITKDLLFAFSANLCYVDGYKVNEPNPEIDDYINSIVNYGGCVNCREIIATGVPGEFIVKLDI